MKQRKKKSWKISLLKKRSFWNCWCQRTSRPRNNNLSALYGKKDYKNAFIRRWNNETKISCQRTAIADVSELADPVIERLSKSSRAPAANSQRFFKQNMFLLENSLSNWLRNVRRCHLADPAIYNLQFCTNLAIVLTIVSTSSLDGTTFVSIGNTKLIESNNRDKERDK